MTSYRTLKPFSAPKAGAVKKPGEQLQPKDEISPKVGEVVALGHLSPEAIAFLSEEGCIGPAEIPAPVESNSNKGGK